MNENEGAMSKYNKGDEVKIISEDGELCGGQMYILGEHATVMEYDASDDTIGVDPFGTGSIDYWLEADCVELIEMYEVQA